MTIVRLAVSPLLWFGRVLLWILFFPLGFWRSLRHSQAKRDRAALRNQRRL